MENGICSFQRKYCLELLHECDMLGCKHVKTPLNCNVIVRSDVVDKNDLLLQNVVFFSKMNWETYLSNS